jgi:cyanophycinase-like exopeptidase
MALRRIFILSIFFLPFELAAQTFYHTGSTVDVDPMPEAGILLAGGSTDNDNSMKWLIQRANGGDVVVLRASGSDGYNEYIYSELGVKVNSVTSIVINGSAQANKENVCKAVQNAELIFIAGGDQWNYYNDWKGTCLQTALNKHVNEKKAPIGGTSAGLAVLGEVMYTAKNSSATSGEALGNPFHSNVTLARNFLQVPFLEQTITDSHYNNPDRRGRHTAFMARMMKDWQMDAKGIGINEFTAVGVDENGIGHVFGNPTISDYAYFIKSNRAPETCESGQPLHWVNDKQALTVCRIKGNTQGSNTFDLSNWQTAEGGEWFYWYVENGVLKMKSAPELTVNDPLKPDHQVLNIFPNPVAEYLHVENTSAKPISSVLLHDLAGRLMDVQVFLSTTGLKINFSGLDAGAYILMISREDDVVTQKIIRK